MKKTLMGAVFGGLLFMAAPDPVRANVIYTFDPSTVDYRGNPGVTIYPYPGIGFTLELADAALGKGGFNLVGDGSGRVSDNVAGFSGDTGNFVFFRTYDVQDYVTPDFIYGRFDVSLTLSAAGDVLDGRLSYGGRGTGLDLTITDNLVSGTWSADFPNCGGCSESGTLARRVTASDVPEPASLALLGFGLAGLAAARRRAA